jgi:hypothetical protein
MEGIGHYEQNIAEIYEKIENHEPLTIDNKIDYYLDAHRIKRIEAEVERDPDRRGRYLAQARQYLERVIRLEKRLNIKVGLPKKPEPTNP